MCAQIKELTAEVDEKKTQLEKATQQEKELRALLQVSASRNCGPCFRSVPAGTAGLAAGLCHVGGL